MTGLEDLGAAVRQVIEKVDEINVICGNVNQEADDAMAKIGVISEGSGSDYIGGAITGLAMAQVAMESVVKGLATCSEALEAYLSSRGI